MQLKPEPTALRRRLIAASCALLSTSAARSQEASDPGFIPGLLKGWQFESALAYYHEDGRIEAIEPVVNASHDYGDGGNISLNFTFDSLSGSSRDSRRALLNTVPGVVALQTALLVPLRTYKLTKGRSAPLLLVIYG